MAGTSEAEDPERDEESPLGKARRAALGALEMFRKSIQAGRALPPRLDVDSPDWNLHERRLGELEEIIRTGVGPEAAESYEELEETFRLEFQAEMARVRSAVEASMVRNLDHIAAKVAEKRFELSSEARDRLDETLVPYQDHFREEMLGRQPIETRRQLEREAKAFGEEDESSPE